MKKLKEMEFFERLLDNPKNELVEKALQEGRVAIGYNCSMVPDPLLSMGSAFPVRLRAPGVGTTELANHYLSTFICTYARSVLEAALDGAYDFLGGLVYAPSCAHITRCSQHFDLLKIIDNNKSFFATFIETSRKVYEPGIRMMADGMRKAAEEMSQRYGIDTSDDALRKAIDDIVNDLEVDNNG